ncbi:MAG: sigma-54-dependent Fis family transcriptional regulator, partial [Polyangiaceae bacterium]|nr:sigma-54-dependent Fis family transcriptional regulator [Polyangiaceae bacterium]
AIWALRERLAFVGPREPHVLVLGESGVGTELVARAIHALSQRRARPLVSRNAATLPAGLIDAELFGNVKSYPQAGMPARPGLIGEADGGVLFLDEIGELPLDLQAHLLRVLDARGEYQRLGEPGRRTADLRLVGATNRAPDELRSDLLARMSLRLSIPGLNERREDVPLLARHLLRRIAERDAAIRRRFFTEGPLEPRVAPALVRALLAHRYTTHVREVEAILWQSLATSERDTLELTDAVSRLLDVAREPAPAPVEISREVLDAALARHGGVRERVWRELGLPNRYVLKRLLKKHGLQQAGGGDDE